MRDEETRQARDPTRFELAGEEVDAQDHRGVAGNVTEFDGNLGLVIGAGGGSLTLFDAVRAHGGEPANYCEIGGNPSVRKACGLAKLVLQKPGVDKIAVMMSIVSNTRVDIVASGVIKACLELGYDRPILSSLHAGYSIAGLAGAGIGGISAWLGISPLPTFAVTAVALVILGLLGGPVVIGANAYGVGLRDALLVPAALAIVVAAAAGVMNRRGLKQCWLKTVLAKTGGASRPRCRASGRSPA